MNQQAICPRCSSRRTRRIRRKGFWQTSILSLIGRYPWECTACRNLFIAGTRGKLKRHHDDKDDTPTAIT